MPYQGRTKVSELKDLIRKYGGTPKGNTVAQLQDELEHLIDGGGTPSGDITVTDDFTDADIDDVFSDDEADDAQNGGEQESGDGV